MEALLEKEANVESWNDERMDELSQRVDAGFEKAATKEEMKLRFGEVDRRFEEVGSRFDHVDHELGRVNDRLDKLFFGLGFFGLTLVLNLAADRL